MNYWLFKTLHHICYRLAHISNQIEKVYKENMINRLKSSKYYIEIASHFQLLSVDKKNFYEYFSSPYRIILIIIFTILFLPHVFVVVKDINFVTAYEVDPGSIIRSILSLYQNSYNMNSAYHSSYYGWTYYSISYFILMPIYFAKALKIITDDYYFFVGLRFIFFMIGLFSTLAYFEIAKRILKHTFLSFIAALLYIASPAISVYFYFLHPESTGLLFLFLGVLCLLNFKDEKAENYRWYTLGLLSLVLSALSKHVFFITALPVLFLFYYSYCHFHNVSILKFAVSNQLAKVLGLSTLLSVLIFFIINPYAFIQPKLFIANQRFMFSTQSEGAIFEIQMQALKQWLEIIKAMPIIYVSIIIVPITLFGAIIFWRNHKAGTIFYVVNIIGAVFYTTIISVSASYLTQPGYLAPVYPFFILNLMIIPLYIFRKWNMYIVKWVTIISLAYFLFFVLVHDFSISIPASNVRMRYQESLIYKVYEYIEENVPYGSKIAHDHLVPISSEKAVIGCQYWQGCGTDYIEEFNPDYVIFSENWLFNGERLPEALRLEKYVSDHHFILVDTIRHEGADFTISVWKKPDP